MTTVAVPRRKELGSSFGKDWSKLNRHSVVHDSFDDSNRRMPDTLLRGWVPIDLFTIPRRGYARNMGLAISVACWGSCLTKEAVTSTVSLVAIARR